MNDSRDDVSNQKNTRKRNKVNIFQATETALVKNNTIAAMGHDEKALVSAAQSESDTHSMNSSVLSESARSVSGRRNNDYLSKGN